MTEEVDSTLVVRVEEADGEQRHPIVSYPILSIPYHIRAEQ